MNKINKFILRDSADTLFDDLIEFENDVDKKQIAKIIEYVQENIEDYTNEDIYKALNILGNYTIDYIGNLDIFEY